MKIKKTNTLCDTELKQKWTNANNLQLLSRFLLNKHHFKKDWALLQSQLEKDLWVSVDQNYDYRSKVSGKQGRKKATVEDSQLLLWLFFFFFFSFFTRRQFVWLRAGVMCFGKYALAFLPPDSNTMIIYFTLLSLLCSVSFPSSSSSPLLVTVNDCLANWNIVPLLQCYYQEEGYVYWKFTMTVGTRD